MAISEIKRLLESEVKDEIELLNGIEVGSTSYVNAVEGVTKLADKIIEIDKLAIDTDERRISREDENVIKNRQIDEDKKSRWINGGIAVASILLPIAVTVWGTKASFMFEKEGTVTTIMGRGFISKLLPRK